ncbi:hypothetical protein BRADI_1g12705v3 [Brachypodium distachyon]|uniref:Secreted protein n=1 Tax=Brachypodium distachyon TaxID=15368 RepID=A0A0Q3NAQ2_BRADI|nr:hypothetical protein BRADI_1g12705v3 [Brachypodium distachyon]
MECNLAIHIIMVISYILATPCSLANTHHQQSNLGESSGCIRIYFRMIKHLMGGGHLEFWNKRLRLQVVDQMYRRVWLQVQGVLASSI